MTSISRKTPRIIPRRTNRAAPYPNSSKQGVSISGELEDELSLSHPVIINGVMVSEGKGLPTIDVPDCERDNHHDGPPDMDYMRPGPSVEYEHVMVDELPERSQEPYVENVLPGVADEVESYPCRFCPERVFLTGDGLLRHTRQQHKQHIIQVTLEIDQISDEWKRREVERNRMRERSMLFRMRQEAIACAAVRQATLTNLSGGDFPDDNFGSVSQEDKFENCRICGLLINQRHPTAMENHMRAHKKNDQLREQLMAEYGVDFVNRLTCHECQLVFTDEKKLHLHTDAMHTRKRKYVCKWCGHVCLSVMELNAHKADVHGISAMRPSINTLTRHRQAAIQQRMGRAMQPPLGVKNPAVAMMQLQAAAGVMRDSLQSPVCRTVCPQCGLTMVRPSLLIRHMLRVHNMDQFESVIDMRGVASYTVKVKDGRVSWECCSQEHFDRQTFIYHRRTCHPYKIDEDVIIDDGQVSIQEHEEEGVEGAEMQTQQGAGGGHHIIDMNALNEPHTLHGELVPGPDGTMHVMVSGPMDSDQVYTLVMMNDDGEPTEVHHDVKPDIRRVTSENHQFVEEESEEVGETMGEGEDQVEEIALSEAELEQLRLQYGDDLDGLIVYVSPETGEVTVDHPNRRDDGGGHVMVSGEGLGLIDKREVQEEYYQE